MRKPKGKNTVHVFLPLLKYLSEVSKIDSKILIFNKILSNFSKPKHFLLKTYSFKKPKTFNLLFKNFIK